MKKILLLLTLFLSVAGIFFSCKKEYSCENCLEKNKLPIAIAGPDKLITLPTDSISLDGSSSSDPDGKINEWLWTKISGPGSSNIAHTSAPKTVVKNLVGGNYQFELKVTDNEGLSARDTVMVMVDDPGTNQPPVANAGPDTTIILPSNTIYLDGSGSSDPDNNITRYVWTKISGPSAYTIVNANAVQTQVANLSYGTYQFELIVTDAGGVFSSDTVQVIVDSQQADFKCELINRPITNIHLTPVGFLSIARDIPSMASAGNKVLFAGGSAPIGPGGHSLTTRVDIYDVFAQSWSTAELSEARVGITSVANGNKILFVGGETFPGATPTSRVDIYDVATDTWSKAELSLPRRNMKTAVVGSKIFFADGEIPGSILTSRVDIFDVSTNSWSTAELSEPRNNMAVGIVGNKVMFAGGSPMSYGLSSRVDIYDNSTNAWTTATLIQGRTQITATTADNKLFFAGGLANNGVNVDPSATIDIYDDATGSWSVSSLSEPKLDMYSIFKDGKIFWAGGTSAWDHINNEGVNSCQVEIKDINVQSNSIEYLYAPTIGSSANIVSINDKIGFARRERFDIYDLTTKNWSIGEWPRGVVPSQWIISADKTIYVVGLADGTGSFPNKVWKLVF